MIELLVVLYFSSAGFSMTFDAWTMFGLENMEQCLQEGENIKKHFGADKVSCSLGDILQEQQEI
jgi:hypothetical protein